MKNSHWIIVVLILLSIPFALHRSSDPTVFGRYSIRYFIFIMAYLTGFAGFLFLLKIRYRNMIISVVFKSLRKLLPSILVEKHYWKLILVAAILHVTLVCVYLSPWMVFSSEPILSWDYAHHYHQVESFVKALSTDRHHWSYDPFFCAGYPEGTIFDVDMKMVELGTFVLTRMGLNISLAYNLVIFSMFLSVPLLLYSACRNFNFTRGITLLVIIPGVLFWHGDPMITDFNRYGMCAFIFGIYWTVLTASLFYRFLNQNNKFVPIALLLALCFGLLVHILMPFLLIPTLAAMYLSNFKSISVRKHALLAFLVFVALAANGWWVATVIRFMPYRESTSFYSPPAMSSLLQKLIRLNDPHLILSIMGIWGFYTFRSRQKIISQMGIISIVYFILLAYFTGNVPLLRNLELGRFSIAAAIFSMVGVAIGVGTTYIGFKVLELRFLHVFPVIVLALYFLGSNMIPVSIFGKKFKDPRKPLIELIEWVNVNTTTEGRIAFMDLSPGFLTVAKMRYYTQRNFINSPFSEMNLKHNYATFVRNRFVGKRLSDLTSADIKKYVDLFNIKWIITTTDEGHAVFRLFTQDIKLVKQFILYVRGKPRSIQAYHSNFEKYKRADDEYPISIFEVKRKPDYFLQGSGDIQADYNRIRISGASPGEVVIKYHWMETLAVSPPLSIERYLVDGNPIGFIKVHNGATKDFTIYNSYRIEHQ